MTDVVLIEVFIMAIVWSLGIYVFNLRYQYILCTCTEFITTDSIGTW